MELDMTKPQDNDTPNLEEGFQQIFGKFNQVDDNESAELRNKVAEVTKRRVTIQGVTGGVYELLSDPQIDDLLALIAQERGRAVRQALNEVKQHDVLRLRDVYMTNDSLLTVEEWLNVRAQLRKEIAADIDKRIAALTDTKDAA